MTPIAKIIITPLSRETIARMTISAIDSPVSAFKRIVVSALLMLMITSMQAQNVGDFLVNEKIASTGRVTLRSWPKGANTLWGTDANSLPQKITLGSGLTLTGTTLSAAGGSWSSITGKPTTLSGFGITDGITAAAAAAAYAPLSHTQAISTVTGLQGALDTKANIVAGSQGQAEQVQIDFNNNQLQNGYYLVLYNAYGSIGLWWDDGSRGLPNYTTDIGWITVPITEEFSLSDVVSATAAALNEHFSFSGATVIGPASTSLIYTLSENGPVNDPSAANTDFGITVLTQGVAPAPTALEAYDGTNLLGLALENHSHEFSSLLNLPTSLAGYGITDALTSSSPLTAANLTGTIAPARLGSGTANSTTYLRGDNTWATLNVGVTSITGTANQITVTGTTTPTLSLPATITGLTSVTSTTFVGALSGTASGNLVSGGALGTPSSGSAANLTNIPAANLTGTINTARLPATITGLTSLTSTTLNSANSVYTGLSLTAAQATNTIDVSTVWNTTGNPSLIYGRATNTASGANARLLSLGTVAGGELVYADKIGSFYAMGNSSSVLQHSVYIQSQSTRLALNATMGLGWGAGNPWDTPFTGYYRDANNITAQRATTNAQTFRVANTWTSATNNEYAVIDWITTANTLRIGSDKGSGGGSNRTVQFIMGGTAKITLSTTGNIVVSGLPTSAPAETNAIWVDTANGNVLKIVP